VGTVLVGVWIAVATAVLQGVMWLVGEAVLASTGRTASGGTYLAAAWVQAFLVVAPAGLLVVLARTFAPDALAVRASARAWLLAGAAAGVLGTVRVLPVQHNEANLGLTAVLATASAVLIMRLQAAENAPDPQLGPQAAALRRAATGFGFAAGLAVLTPWLWAGALGGVAETIAAAAAAGATGLLAAAILDRAFFAGFARSRARQVLVGGLAAAVTLGVLGSGLGGGALNLAELLVLSLLGVVAGALAAATNPLPRGWFSYSRGRGRGAKPALSAGALTALVGVAALGPLALVDPEESSLLLGTRDVGFWAGVAAALSLAVALVVAVGYGVLLRPGQGPGRRVRWLPASVAAIVAAGAAAVYLGAGQPGFYGDRLFVVMAEQADLGGLATITDRPGRLRATYQRLVTQAERSQAPLRRSLARLGLSYTPYYLVNGILVHGAGPLLRQWLARRSDVDRVLLDQRLRPLPAAPPVAHGTDAGPDGRPQWNIQLIGAERVWELGVTGQGIVIGSSDSGVDGSHPALAEGFRGGDDSWYDPWNATTVPTDHGGHGTHTLGSAEGRGGIGVAPGAQWVGCVNLDRNLGSPSHYLDCLQFMLAPFPRGGDPWQDGRPERAPHVLTNSWGCPDLEGCDLDALRPATAALRAAGVFVVAAAGNTGPRCGSIDDPPAPYPDVFTVGAVDRQRAVAEFSSRGPTDDGREKPDVLAPGVDVLSALPGGTYGTEAGTSMATPHVAGVVALMWSAQPRLIGDIDATAGILRQTGTDARIPTSVSQCGDPTDVTGRGIVDAFAAVQAARALG
jgi:hypothetical protein